MEKSTSHIIDRNPGAMLKRELKSCGLTQKVFAEMIGVRPSYLSEVVQGKRPVTKQFADKLEAHLNIPSSVWLKSQAKADYVYTISELESRDSFDIEKELIAYDEIYDLKTIFKYVGILNESTSERYNFCKDVLHFDSSDKQKRIISGYFHKSEKTGLNIRMIATWSVLAMFEASRQPAPVGTFQKDKCDELANKLSVIFNDNCNTVNRVARTLSEYGVKFCVVPKVQYASIDGFSFYANGTPCVVITKRFNRIDNFAFAILHEIGHLKLHLISNSIGKVTVANSGTEDLSKEEEQANEYAANVLIPEEIWNAQPAVQMNPKMIQARFTKWAKEINVNKWIVLGRVSYETGIYMFKSDKTREIN